MVGKFVEFFGPGVEELSVADRATISNMCPEYGATVGFFALDRIGVDYLRQTSKSRSLYLLYLTFFFIKLFCVCNTLQDWN